MATIGAPVDQIRARFFERASDSFVVLDEHGVIRDCNQAYAGSLGRRRGELIGTRVVDHVDVELDVEMVRHRSRSTGSSSQIGWESRRRTGDRVLMRWESTFDPISGTEFLVGRDLTVEYRTAAALMTSERFFDLSTEFMAVVGADGRVHKINDAFCAFLGRSREELVGAVLDDYVHPGDVSTSRSVDARMRSAGTLSAESFDVRYRSAAGEWRLLSVRAVHSPTEGDVHLLGQDITDQRRLTEELRIKATVDPLTGLANRAVMWSTIGERLDAGEPVAVLLLDLDDFKIVNDSLGHAAGDELLVEVGRRLSGFVRPTDLVARLGGDEFGVVAPDVSTIEGATRLAERLLDRMGDPFEIDDRVLHTKVSIGVTVSSGRGDRGGRGRERGPDDLLAEADTAAYRAKELGKDRFEIFDTPLRQRAAERLALESSLHRAIEASEFDVDLQPIVDIADGQLVACEALLRWEHPEKGRLAPGSFIDVAERSGLIVPIGRQVLDAALRTRQRWLGHSPGVDISVNFAARQLAPENVIEEIIEAVDRWGQAPAGVTIEVTESALMEDRAASVLEELSERGFKIAIDDFGTGYSSLSYLRRLPLDVLKVDRSFVIEVAENRTARTILRAIADMADALGVDLVVEGVETEEQREAVAALGCRLAQGYLFHRPMPPAAALDLVIATPSRPRPSQNGDGPDRRVYPPVWSPTS